MSHRGSDDQFKTLQSIWYEKIKDAGFKDAEDVNHPNSPLIVWHSLKWKSCSPERIKAIQDYFDQARDLIDTYPFDNSTHKHIWILHSDGLSKRQIEKAIINLTPTYKREQIGNIITLISASIL